jgi:hypothetical protein
MSSSETASEAEILRFSPSVTCSYQDQKTISTPRRSYQVVASDFTQRTPPSVDTRIQELDGLRGEGLVGREIKAELVGLKSSGF